MEPDQKVVGSTECVFVGEGGLPQTLYMKYNFFCVY